MRLNVVPQFIVDELGPALGGTPGDNYNTGRIIAEEFMRGDGADFVLSLCEEDPGTEVTSQVTMRLPPLRPGYTWQTVADRLRQRAQGGGA